MSPSVGLEVVLMMTARRCDVSNESCGCHEEILLAILAGSWLSGVIEWVIEHACEHEH